MFNTKERRQVGLIEAEAVPAYYGTEGSGKIRLQKDGADLDVYTDQGIIYILDPNDGDKPKRLKWS